MTTERAFSHEAMNTTFTLRLPHEEEKEAAGIARECFEHLDYLENKLSRYIEGSDVWQINNMEAGQSLFLSEPANDCLRLAMEMGQLTGGLFDVTIGGSIEHFKNSEDGPAPALCGTLSLDPDRPIIHCLDPGREIDLGGIGKGFALDQMKALMQDWGVDAALLAAGSSTQLAFGPETWTLDLSGDKAVRHITLENAALSASGSRIQGSHILHPAGKVNNSALSRVWVMCQGAARADAWSTALMLRQKDDFGEQFPSGIHYMGECDGVLAGNFPASS